MHTDPVRAKTFNIRFSDEEWTRLDAIASHYGITAAAVIRMLLKREEQALGLATPPKPARGASAKKPSR
jgi:transposase